MYVYNWNKNSQTSLSHLSYLNLALISINPHIIAQMKQNKGFQWVS